MNPLFELRKEVGVTQAVMAQHMGVPLRTYEDLEGGKSKIRPIHINAAKWACLTIQQNTTLDTVDKDVNAMPGLPT